MNLNLLLTELNTIVETIDFLDLAATPNADWIRYRLLDGVFFLIPEDMKERWFRAIHRLHELSKVKYTYTRNEFEEKLLRFIFQILRNSTDEKNLLQTQDWKEFQDSLLVMPRRKYSVLRPIHGLSLDSAESSLTLGKWTIYNLASHQSLIEREDWENSNSRDDQSSYAITCESTARHAEQALVVADREFSRFESILHYMLQAHKPLVQIVDTSNFAGTQQAYMRVGEEPFKLCSISHHGFLPEICLSHYDLNDQHRGYEYIWSLTTSDSLNEMQLRVLDVVECVGKARVMVRKDKALVDIMTVLEVLLVKDGRANTSRIAEAIAFLVGESVERRIKLNGQVKNIYNLRSKVVHQASEITPPDFWCLVEIAYRVIYKLTTSQELISISSTKELQKLLQEVKYSGRIFNITSGNT